MKIFIIKNKEIIESDTEKFDYRQYVSTPRGLMPEVFFENGLVKYWARDKVKVVELSTLEEHANHWQKVIRIEFENFAENEGNLDFYYDLETAQNNLKELTEEKCE